MPRTRVFAKLFSEVCDFFTFKIADLLVSKCCSRHAGGINILISATICRDKTFFQKEKIYRELYQRKQGQRAQCRPIVVVHLTYFFLTFKL